jgi:dienelactone hydrolase
VHLDDKRWEVRDAQWLAGGLVQSGHADAQRLAITGGSYGGAPTASAALLAGKTMCGGAPVPATLGPDPCAGKRDGALVPWRTPDGRTPLVWAAAVPMYTFSDLLQVLAPNGRSSDGWRYAPRDGNHTNPFGVPLQTTVSGLLLVAQLTASLALPGTDADADIITDSRRLLAGNPFPQRDPELAADRRLYEQFKSPITTKPQGRVPIFWVGGLTDALFPAFEPLTLLRRIQAAQPSYPFKLFLGDLGHDYAAERQDEWDIVKPQMNAFVDHYLRPDRTPEAPRFDAAATFTRCLDHDAPARSVSASRWHDLHPARITFVSNARGETSTEQQGPAGAATDPISTATLPGPNSYKGCRMMRPSQPDPTVATYEFSTDRALDMMGGPVVAVTFTATGTDVPLSVRLWDVAGDRSVQGLVTRATYRVRGP